MRVERGALTPADDLTRAALRKMDLHIGDEVRVILVDPRTLERMRRAHKLAALLIQNCEAFAHYTDAHAVLKRLQIESGAGCDETAVCVPNLGMVSHRTPRSLAFDAMDEGEFRMVYASLCRYIGTEYIPGMAPQEIDDMSKLMEIAA